MNATERKTWDAHKQEELAKAVRSIIKQNQQTLSKQVEELMRDWMENKPKQSQ